MRPIKAREQLIIPDNGTHLLTHRVTLDLLVSSIVKVTVNSRVVQVSGKRGKLVRNFRHCRVDISMPKKNLIVVEKWFGTNKENAIVRTICSHINNMVKGVTTVSQRRRMPQAKNRMSRFFAGLLLQDAFRLRSLSHQHRGDRERSIR